MTEDGCIPTKGMALGPLLLKAVAEGAWKKKRNYKADRLEGKEDGGWHRGAHRPKEKKKDAPYL